MRYLFLILSILAPCLFLSSCLGSKTYVVSNYDDIQKTPLHADGVYGRGLSDEDMLYLGRLKNIEVIDLCFNSHIKLNLTDNGLKNLAKIASKLPKLRIISVCKSDLITDKGLYWISKIKQIDYVNISNCSKVTNEGFRFLSNNSGIKGINMLYLEHVDNTTLQYLKDMPNLESLVSRGSRFLDTDSMRIISEFKKPKILMLTLENSPDFNDLSLKELSKSKTIESLTIEVNANITPNGILSLAGIKSLKDFYLYKCPAILVDKEMLKQFHSSLPNCEVLFEDSDYHTLYRYEPSGNKHTRPDLISSTDVSKK